MNQLSKIATILLILFCWSCSKDTHQGEELLLWYDSPASDWMKEALPLGNGHMGAMFFGGVDKERIQFTEGSLWAGGPGVGESYNYGIREGAWKYLSEVRELLDAGKMEEAHALAGKELTGISEERGEKMSFGTFGAQQPMGIRNHADGRHLHPGRRTGTAPLPGEQVDQDRDGDAEQPRQGQPRGDEGHARPPTEASFEL